MQSITDKVTQLCRIIDEWSYTGDKRSCVNDITTVEAYLKTLTNKQATLSCVMIVALKVLFAGAGLQPAPGNKNTLPTLHKILNLMALSCKPRPA
ncbi:MAG: hypothetical protein ABFS56_29190 [Pseudomonadota bacterium]